MTQFIHIEVPEPLLQRLIDRSQRMGVTLNQLCVQCLSEPITWETPVDDDEQDSGILRPGDTP